MGKERRKKKWKYVVLVKYYEKMLTRKYENQLIILENFLKPLTGLNIQYFCDQFCYRYLVVFAVKSVQNCDNFFIESSCNGCVNVPQMPVCLLFCNLLCELLHLTAV